MATDNVARLLETYEAFVAGELERIPEFFDPEGFYRTSGVFPGMKERYVGHAEIESSGTPPRALGVLRDRAPANGRRRRLRRSRGPLYRRGLGSGVEVTIDAGHLVRFRDGLICEFSAYASWEEALAAADACLASAVP